MKKYLFGKIKFKMNESEGSTLSTTSSVGNIGEYKIKMNKLDDYLRDNINNNHVKNHIDPEWIAENQEWELQSPWELFLPGYNPKTSNTWNTRTSSEYPDNIKERIIVFIKDKKLRLRGEYQFGHPKKKRSARLRPVNLYNPQLAHPPVNHPPVMMESFFRTGAGNWVNTETRQPIEQHEYQHVVDADGWHSKIRLPSVPSHTEGKRPRQSEEESEDEEEDEEEPIKIHDSNNLKGHRGPPPSGSGQGLVAFGNKNLDSGRLRDSGRLLKILQRDLKSLKSI